MWFTFYVFCIFHVSYLYVSCSGSIISVGEERAKFSGLFSCTCNFVVSIQKGFLFLVGVWNGLHYVFVALHIIISRKEWHLLRTSQ